MSGARSLTQAVEKGWSPHVRNNSATGQGTVDGEEGGDRGDLGDGEGSLSSRSAMVRPPPETPTPTRQLVLLLFLRRNEEDDLWEVVERSRRNRPFFRSPKLMADEIESCEDASSSKPAPSRARHLLIRLCIASYSRASRGPFVGQLFD